MAFGLATRKVGARRFGDTALLRAALGCLLVWEIGINVDGWYHLHRGFEIESFFTWAHGLVYGGWIAVGLCVMLYLLESVYRGEPRERLLPPGFLLVLLGEGLFGFSGSFDLLWHSRFGFEVGFEATITPPHQLLVAAMFVVVYGLLMASINYRSRNGSFRYGLDRGNLPLTVSVAALFALSLYLLSYTDPMDVDYAAGGRIAVQLIGHSGMAFGTAMSAITGVTGIILHSILLTIFLILPLHRLRLPGGSVAAIILWVGLVSAAAEDTWIYFPAAIAAALVGEALWALMWRGKLGGLAAGTGYWTMALVLPVVQFFVYFALAAGFGGGIIWTTHLWAGAPIMAGLYSLIAAVLAIPPRSVQDWLARTPVMPPKDE